MVLAMDYLTDSMQFDPSRWLDERLQKHVLSNPFNFVPFNAGVYVCMTPSTSRLTVPTHIQRPADLSRAAGVPLIGSNHQNPKC